LCLACISLELECHGYGPKPQWMDNGILQKDQASKIKRTVTQTKSKKKGKQLLPTTQSGPGLLSLVSPAFTSTQYITGWNDALTQGEFPYSMSDTDINSIMDPPWNASSLNDVLTIESSYNKEGYVPVPAPATPNGINLGQNSMTSGSSEEIAMSDPCLLPVSKADTAWVNIIPQDNIRAVTNERISSTLSESMCGTSQGVSGNVNGYVGSNSSSEPCSAISNVRGRSMLRQPAAGESILSEDPEDTLFMHYLDEVFYVQYPFYHCRERQRRGWLFSILKRVPSAYHAALALSERYLLSIQAQNSNITTSLAQLRAEGGYYDLAFQEMQIIIEEAHKWDDCTHLVHTLGGLTSILLLLFYEVRLPY
jgi:hypothetical protein